MRYNIHINKYFNIAVLSLALGLTSCDKLLEIEEPRTFITTKKVFDSNAQAESAMAGVYSQLINSPGYNNTFSFTSFASGSSGIISGLASDEYLFTYNQASWEYFLSRNSVTIDASSFTMTPWVSAYDCINGVNTVLEGIAESKSVQLTQAVRDRLNGESKFLRAYAYFYLVNFFGDVPLVLSGDFNKTSQLPRSASSLVYQQIVQDLEAAAGLLPATYNSANGDRIIPNRWAAKALLARVNLYMKNYEAAASLSKEIIDQNDLYYLEPSIENVFLKGSPEMIFQLKQSSNKNTQNNATPEGTDLIPVDFLSSQARYVASNQLLNAFEPGDKRKEFWLMPTDANGDRVYFPYKYKTGAYNSVFGAEPTEYQVQIRLSEIYLIRAEALLMGSTKDKDAAIALVNELRARAGLTVPVSNTISDEEAFKLIQHERQVELFGEGHRWFDLIRTGKATETLSAIPLKQPWKGDYQLKIPIPDSEVKLNPKLVQNQGY
ncbi:hypothetical protein COR50_19705 [Chitinophaga caeni]|uniref:RagB/SusD family nutrient uptake outer membrane protein n=1 Tax=Chitinophaga caeni TaxID=2029983 RepID=A0A291QZ35_9BACT|nr:RagB/SusD family nutrient uptake outer membrane protein [Chitinophaga caeni]ATL49220.1 hypothetical protein COR50_19705 [Chitinophaga caeni]